MKTKQQLFEEMDKHLVTDERPSDYFNWIKDEDLFSEFPFILLNKLRDVPQSPEHHPEGNVWNHTMMVLDEAAKVKGKSRNGRVFMWAVLLHDIGKSDTTKRRNGKITSYDHDKVGAEQSKQFLQEFSDDADLIQNVSALIRWHMQILFVVKNMRFADIASMKRQTDIDEVALLGYCDRMGRLGADQDKEKNNIRQFVQKCRASDLAETQRIS